jgi:hypothetical protein
LFQILLKMRSVASYTPDSLVEFGAKKLFKCSSYFFTVPKGNFPEVMSSCLIVYHLSGINLGLSC